MRGRGEPAILPHNPAPYLIEWLFEIGPTCAGSMGECPLTYLEMAAWQAVSGVELMPWEASLIRRLSAEYASMRHKAEEQSCPAPYSAVDDLAANRDRVARQVDAVFGKLKKKEA